MSMERTRTILLAAWGGNNGHVVHCARLGRTAVDHGWRAVVVHERNDVHADLVREAGCESLTYRRDLTTDNDRWHCWHSEQYVKRSVESDLLMLEDIRPDVIVHDVRPSLPVAAEIMQIPHAAICHCTYLPGFSFAGLGTSELWLGGLNEFNRVLDAWGQPPISRDLREMFVRGLIFVPSMPEFDPVPAALEGRTHFIGPLSGLRRRQPSGARRGEGVFLYRTVGDNEALEEFCGAFADLDRQVLIATGSEELRRKLAARVGHTGFDVRSMWNMSAVLDRVGVAVHHGGPGVTLGCLAGGVPAVALPGDSPERQLYGTTLESLGLGASLSAEPSLDTSWHAAVDTTQRMPSWYEVRRLVDSLGKSDEVWTRCRSWSERLVDMEPHASIAAMDALYRSGGST